MPNTAFRPFHIPKSSWYQMDMTVHYSLTSYFSAINVKIKLKANPIWQAYTLFQTKAEGI